MQFSSSGRRLLVVVAASFRPRSCPAVRTFLSLSVPLVQSPTHILYKHTHTQPAPRPRHTVSRYVLCLILVGNTDHIIVIVQSCAARGEQRWWCGWGAAMPSLLLGGGAQRRPAGRPVQWARKGGWEGEKGGAQCYEMLEKGGCVVWRTLEAHQDGQRH